MKKRFFVIIMAVVALFSLVACDDGESDTNGTTGDAGKPVETVAYSRTNPAPLGTAVEVTKGKEVVSIKVLEVVRGDDAITKIKAWNPYNSFSPTKEDTEPLLFNIEYTLIQAENDESFSPSAFLTLKPFSSSGSGYEISYLDTAGSESAMEIFEGATTKEWVLVEANKDDSAPILRYAFLSSSEGWFALY